MFGISLWKIAAVIIAVGLLVGYFKYTQDKMAELNGAIAQKEFALKAAQATIEKQAEDMKKQAEVQKKTFEDMQAARAKASELEAKFSKHNLNEIGNAKPTELEKKVNKATDRVFRCIEDVINKGATNAAGC
jgi:hypothetical protein